MRVRGQLVAERTAWDGQPFYCARCGEGFQAFIACELGVCALESEAEARRRAGKGADDEESICIGADRGRAAAGGF